MKMAARAFRALRRDGIIVLLRKRTRSWERRIKRAYGTRIRPVLPVIGYPQCNGVVVARPRRLLDPLVPRSWIPESIYEDYDSYESALVGALEEHVVKNDRVVIVGGGYGVTLVVAARAAGKGGSITCYEAVKKRIEDIKAAMRMNGVDTPVTLHEAIVGKAIALHGFGWNAPIVSPETLPECDVLEMDCEGAEVEVLSNLQIRPRIILVETHGELGAPTYLVRELLERLGYDVEDRGEAEAEPEAAVFCRDHDIRVLLGKRQ